MKTYEQSLIDVAWQLGEQAFNSELEGANNPWEDVNTQTAAETLALVYDVKYEDVFVALSANVNAAYRVTKSSYYKKRDLKEVALNT